MNKKILFFFFICSSYLLNAQYTNVINSNRPGFSESPYSVGSGIYQLETGFFYNSSQIVRTFTIPRSFGYNMVFRTSFFDDKLEFNTNFTLQSDKVAFKNVFTSDYFTTGVSDFSFGAKYLFFHQEYEDKSKEIRSWKRRHAFDWKRAIPSVAIYVGVNSNLVNNIYKLEGLTPKFGVLLQNNLSKKLNIVTNLYYDNIGSSYSEFAYIVTGTYAFNETWSTFLEHQGSYNKYQTNTDFGTGIAYLSGRHFQIDASTRLNFNGKTTEFYTGIGFSFRLDRHVPEFDLLDEKGNVIIEDDPVSTKKKKFFGRLLDFFKFKKKDKSNEKKYDRKKPVRKRIESTTKKKDTKKKKGGFFSFLKRKNKKEDDTKKKDDTKQKDETKNDTK
ncbi:transporter [Polaribacter uvawellassae]|uniref:transporter n=1 Tax=Polaribacter uvawellassae TaxID=3133495 RepID=UPI00321AA110